MDRETIGTACAGTIMCIIYMFVLGICVSACVSLGYGIKFLVTDFNIFHDEHDNGDCNGSELWNILVGTVATTVFDMLCSFTIISSAIITLGLIVAMCATIEDEVKAQLCQYICTTIISYAYSLTFAILIGNEFTVLDGCATVMNSNLGTFAKVKYYLHLTNSWAISLSYVMIISKLFMSLCCPAVYNWYVEKKKTNNGATLNNHVAETNDVESDNVQPT